MEPNENTNLVTIDKADYEKHLADAEKAGFEKGAVTKENDMLKNQILTFQSVGMKSRFDDMPNKFGALTSALAVAKRLDKNLGELVKSEWKDAYSKDFLEQVAQKSITTGASSGGWYLIPQYAEELIPALRDNTVVLQAGARMIDLVNGQLLYRTQGTGTDAAWVGEATNFTQSEITGTQSTISAKKLGAIAVVSNEMLKYASPEIDAFIQADITGAMATKLDSTYLRATASSTTPAGFLSLINAANKFAANATQNAVNITADLGTMMLKVKQAKIRDSKFVWFFSPRIEFVLKMLRETTGFLTFAEEMKGGTLMGAPYFVTTAIPENLGTGTNESEIYLVDMNQVLIGKDTDLEVLVDPNGSYHNGTNVVSGMSTDETVFRAKMKSVMGMRYDKAGAVLTTVKWA